MCVSDLLCHVSLVKTRPSESNVKKMKEIKCKYERQLRYIQREMKRLDKEHIEKKVN